MTGQHRSYPNYSSPSEKVPLHSDTQGSYLAVKHQLFTPKHLAKQVNRLVIFSGLSWIFAVIAFACTLVSASARHSGSWFHAWFIETFSAGLLFSIIVFPLAFILGTFPIKNLQKLLPRYIHTEITVLMLKVIFVINIIAFIFWLLCAATHTYTFLVKPFL
ncbi:hypothetical protein [Corynebacterium freiburgense]|uniref:hypothetical protein n=1 Tax=Corynebacterium freiburgense TaxID=556548 RepID=UPI00047CA238|nr:hypothetical protein [Corynebacterium freiburgense]WJZ03276.1 hypothetical protein CFREI_10000 [Corynebacterium freiburgense]